MASAPRDDLARRGRRHRPLRRRPAARPHRRHRPALRRPGAAGLRGRRRDPAGQRARSSRLSGAAIMAAEMATRTTPALRRDASHRVLGGVCAGLARQLGVDPLIVRVAFVAAAFAGGIGVAIYVAAWVLVPAGDAPARPTAAARRARHGRGDARRRAARRRRRCSPSARSGIWFSDAIVWPVGARRRRRRAAVAPVLGGHGSPSRAPGAPAEHAGAGRPRPPQRRATARTARAARSRGTRLGVGARHRRRARLPERHERAERGARRRPLGARRGRRARA